MKSPSRLILFVLVLLSLTVIGYSQTLNLLQTIGSTNDDSPQDMKIDNKGNLYIIGQRASGSGTGLRIGTAMVSFRDTLFHSYILKLDSTGKKLKAIASTIGNNRGYSTIAIDSQGNIYAIGQGDLVQSQTGLQKKSSYTPPYSGHFFIAKYDSNLVFVWVKTSQSAVGSICSNIKADDSGCVFTGFYTGQTTLDTFAVRNPANDGNDPNHNSSNAFIGRLDGNGSCRFFVNAGKGLIETRRMGIAPSRDIYLTGYSCLFLPPEKDSSGISGAAPTSYICGNPSGFVSKYSFDGKFQWVRKIEKENSISDCQAIAINSSTGNILTGNIVAPNDDSFNLLYPKCVSSYIFGFSSNGDSLWADILRPFNLDPAGGCNLGDGINIFDLNYDSKGALFVIGRAFSGIVFGNDTLYPLLPSGGSGFVCTYLPNGNKNWISRLSWKKDGTSPQTFNFCRFVFNGDHIFAVGSFSQIVTEDNTMDSRGSRDIFVAQVNPELKSAIYPRSSSSVLTSSLNFHISIRNGYIRLLNDNTIDGPITEVSVFNTTGKKVVSFDHALLGETSIRIPCTHLSHGIYFIAVSTKTETIVKNIELSR